MRDQIRRAASWLPLILVLAALWALSHYGNNPNEECDIPSGPFKECG